MDTARFIGRKGISQVIYLVCGGPIFFTKGRGKWVGYYFPRPQIGFARKKNKLQLEKK